MKPAQTPSNKPMNIVITGVTGFRNRGVEALVRPTILQLAARHPQARITVVTWSPEYDALRLPHPQVSYVLDPYLKCGRWVQPNGAAHHSLWKRALNKAAKKLGRSNGSHVPLAMPFETPDLIVVTGGDLYSSDYGTTSLGHFTAPVHWARERKVPVALIGQSVGKFKCEQDIKLWKHAEEEASLVTLREPLSQDYLCQELKSPAERLPVTADTAFLLEPETEVAAGQLRFTDNPVVALSISESISGWTGSNYERHAAAWVRLIRLMLDKWQVSVAIIPHVQEVYADDRVISTRILRELGFDHRVRVFAEDLGAGEFKGLISKCDLVVAERMHAAIAGLSTGRCTVPVGYSIKAEGITAAVLQASGIRANDLVTPVADLMEADTFFKKLDAIWNDRQRFAEAIRLGVPRMAAEAKRNFELVDGLL